MISTPKVNSMDRKLVQRFESRQKYYTVLNVLLMIWFFCQMVIYGVEINSYKDSCGQVYSLGVYYIITYLINFFVPVFALLAAYKWSCMAVVNMIYIVFNIILEVVVVIILFTIGWRHVGMCYISTSIKIVIICICVVQVLTLAMEFVLMYRRRQINRMKENFVKIELQNTTITGKNLQLNLIN